jgi:hypothetical protein
MTTSSSVVAQLETTLAESAGKGCKRKGIAASPPGHRETSWPKSFTIGRNTQLTHIGYVYF